MERTGHELQGRHEQQGRSGLPANQPVPMQLASATLSRATGRYLVYEPESGTPQSWRAKAQTQENDLKQEMTRDSETSFNRIDHFHSSEF